MVMDPLNTPELVEPSSDDEFMKNPGDIELTMQSQACLIAV